MSKILWRGKNKKDGELELQNNVLPADPKAVLKKDGDAWIIVGDAVLSSKPVIVKKG